MISVCNTGPVCNRPFYASCMVVLSSSRFIDVFGLTAFFITYLSLPYKFTNYRKVSRITNIYWLAALAELKATAPSPSTPSFTIVTILRRPLSILTAARQYQRICSFGNNSNSSSRRSEGVRDKHNSMSRAR